MKHIVIWRQALLVLCLSCSFCLLAGGKRDPAEWNQCKRIQRADRATEEYAVHRGRERRIFPIEEQYVWYDDACPHAESLGI